MKKTYIVANVFWLVLAMAVCLESWRLNVGGVHRPGPGFLPFYTAILLGILALVSLVQTIKGPGGPGSGIWGGIRFGKLILMIGSLFLYTLLLDQLGFLLGTFLLLIVLFRIVEPYRWTTVVLFSLLTIGGTYLFFVVLLESRLPRGFLGF
jgi:putative tricarboxylic transport membrane protein